MINYPTLLILIPLVTCHNFQVRQMHLLLIKLCIHIHLNYNVLSNKLLCNLSHKLLLYLVTKTDHKLSRTVHSALCIV
jgi:hypothetical protein